MVSFDALGTSERFFNVFKMVSPPSPLAGQPLYAPGTGAVCGQSSDGYYNNSENFRSFIECHPSVVFGRRHIFPREHTTTAILSMRKLCRCSGNRTRRSHGTVICLDANAGLPVIRLRRGCCRRAAFRDATGHVRMIWMAEQSDEFI